MPEKKKRKNGFLKMNLNGDGFPLKDAALDAAR
jgi:hypothetical protein